MNNLRFASRRPVVVAERGAVACADPRAALMGLGESTSVVLFSLPHARTVLCRHSTGDSR